MQDSKIDCPKLRAERDQLLERVTKVLEQDTRIVAAWLFGSLGRDEEDDLSDLDVWIVVDDPHLDDVIRERSAFTAQFGSPILTIDAPQNAPAGGAYLMTVHKGEASPHQVDWYWQGRVNAFPVPPQTRLLVNRGASYIAPDKNPGTHKSVPPIFSEQEREAEGQQHRISLFYAMVMISAKYTFRNPDVGQAHFLPMIDSLAYDAAQYLGLGRQDAPDLSQSTALEKLAVLQDRLQHMDTILDLSRERGILVPIDAPSASRQYLAMVERNLNE